MIRKHWKNQFRRSILIITWVLVANILAWIDMSVMLGHQFANPALAEEGHSHDQQRVEGDAPYKPTAEEIQERGITTPPRYTCNSVYGLCSCRKGDYADCLQMGITVCGGGFECGATRCFCTWGSPYRK